MNRIDRISGESQPPLEPGPRGENRETADARDARRGQTGPGAKGTATAAPRRRLNPLIPVIGGIVLVVGALVLWNWWQNSSNYETTDDAFIDTHIVRLSPQIAGRVVHVLVNDNQLVQPGALLVEID